MIKLLDIGFEPSTVSLDGADRSELVFGRRWGTIISGNVIVRGSTGLPFTLRDVPVVIFLEILSTAFLRVILTKSVQRRLLWDTGAEFEMDYIDDKTTKVVPTAFSGAFNVDNSDMLSIILQLYKKAAAVCSQAGKRPQEVFEDPFGVLLLGQSSAIGYSLGSGN